MSAPTTVAPSPLRRASVVPISRVVKKMYGLVLMSVALASPLPVPVAGPRVEAVVRPRVVPDHGELPVQEDVAARRRAVPGGQALNQERGSLGRVEVLPPGALSERTRKKSPSPKPT